MATFYLRNKNTAARADGVEVEMLDGKRVQYRRGENALTLRRSTYFMNRTVCVSHVWTGDVTSWDGKPALPLSPEEIVAIEEDIEAGLMAIGSLVVFRGGVWETPVSKQPMTKGEASGEH